MAEKEDGEGDAEIELGKFSERKRHGQFFPLGLNNGKAGEGENDEGVLQLFVGDGLLRDPRERGPEEGNGDDEKDD